MFLKELFDHCMQSSESQPVYKTAQQYIEYRKAQRRVDALTTKRLVENAFPPSDRQPREGQIILRFLEWEDYRPASCRRAILEVCALKMSDDDRRQIVAPTHRPECWLYKALREKKIYHWKVKCNWDFSLEDEDVLCDAPPLLGLVLQKWYQMSEKGQVEVVDALFQIISADPAAFYHMVSDGSWCCADTKSRLMSKEHNRDATPDFVSHEASYKSSYLGLDSPATALLNSYRIARLKNYIRRVNGEPLPFL